MIWKIIFVVSLNTKLFKQAFVTASWGSMEDYKAIYAGLLPGLKQKFANARLILLDFDGVLTDNTVIHAEDGSEAVVRSRADTIGIDMLRDKGLYKNDGTGELDLMILSRETNKLVSSVAEKIEVRCVQSRYNKLTALRREVAREKLSLAEVVFIGNDFNDLECMRHVVDGRGLGVAVADAYNPLKQIADYTTTEKGGRGAVREIIELLLYAKRMHPVK